MRSTCVHCRQKLTLFRFGLCTVCASYRSLRVRYRRHQTPQRPCHRRDEADYVAPLPASATDAPKGSIDKLKVMRERLLRGEQLFHPGDNQTVAPDYQRLSEMSRYHGPGSVYRDGKWWRARVTSHRKRLHLGRYPSEDAAWSAIRDFKRRQIGAVTAAI